MKKPVHNPPAFFLTFFRWYCHPAIQTYIEGDLMEVYDRRVKHLGKRKADIKFILDVLLLFRPGIIKPAEGHQQLNTYGMYKSYFKIGWRSLLRNKAYALINIGGLALSITCGIIIFSLVKHHLSFDNFHTNRDRIYKMVTEQHREGISYTGNVPSPLGEAFRTDHTYGEKTARIFINRNVLVTLRKQDNLIKFKETEGVAFTERTFFDIFNFPLAAGNAAKALTDPNTAIVTERMAKKYFGENNALGEIIWLDNKIPFTITGIVKDLPENSDFRCEIFVSYVTLKEYNPFLASETRGWGGIRDGMYCFTVLRPGVSPAQVEKVLQPYVKQHRPTSKNVHHYKLQPLADVHFNTSYGGPMAKQNLWILSIIGLFLLGTACVNFINLATAQALKRSKEVGVRKVLGSLRKQLFWQFIFETLIITSISAVIAMVAASLLAPFANALFNTQIPLNLLTDGVLVLFILGLTLVITFLAGYYPAFILSGFQPVAALKGKLSQQRVGGFNTRRTLIVTQFAISQVLIIGVVVIMNQMRYARQADLGFDKDAIVMVTMGNDSLRIMKNVKDEISKLSGVEKVSLCFTAPASEDDWGNSIRFDNNTEEVDFRTSMKLGDADYIPTFNLELAAGRNLSPSDTVREVLVNEALLYKLGIASPDEALGKMVSANGGSMNGPIVGVVKNFHDKSFHQEISAVLITTSSENYSNYAVKLNVASAKPTLEAIEKIWLHYYPDQLFEYNFLDESIERFYETETTILKAIQVFSFIAIFIGCLGLYGLVSFMVAQKTKEVGIRKILGGGITHIVWIFGLEFTRLVVIAFLIAAPIGWWAMNNWLQGFEFKIKLDVWTFVLAVGCSLVIASLTVSYQVIKAASANPVKSLRNE